jgi:hypothetical protein
MALNQNCTGDTALCSGYDPMIFKGDIGLYSGFYELPDMGERRDPIELYSPRP